MAEVISCETIAPITMPRGNQTWKRFSIVVLILRKHVSDEWIARRLD